MSTVASYFSAAENGNVDAMLILGVCYAKGEDVPQDFAKAVKWFHEAAVLGNSKAMNYLGICFQNGDGVQQDYEQAIEWYRKATDGGNANAWYNLGSCYEKGQGVAQDDAHAATCYKNAIEAGEANGDSEYQLGLMSGYGRDHNGKIIIPRNLKLALTYYEAAAAKNHSAGTSDGFNETSGAQEQINKIRNRPCDHGINCTNHACIYAHPKGWTPKKKTCRYGSNCKRKDCIFGHPKDWSYDDIAGPAASSTSKSSSDSRWPGPAPLRPVSSESSPGSAAMVVVAPVNLRPKNPIALLPLNPIDDDNPSELSRQLLSHLKDRKKQHLELVTTRYPNQPHDLNATYFLHGDVKLGKGSAGEVYLGGKKGFKTSLVAIKILKITENEAAKKELDNMFELRENLHAGNRCLRLEDGLVARNGGIQNLYIITEYCPATLMDVIDKLTPDDQLFISTRIVEVVKYLHKNKFVHRDLHASNIFLTLEGDVKLGDFGHSKTNVETTVETELVAHRLQPVECHNTANGQQVVRPSVDVFMLGQVLHHLWSQGHYAFADGVEINQLTAVVRVDPWIPHPKIQSAPLLFLLRWMLDHKYDKRPTIQQVANHPFFWTFSRKVSEMTNLKEYIEIEDQSDHEKVTALFNRNRALWTVYKNELVDQTCLAAKLFNWAAAGFREVGWQDEVPQSIKYLLNEVFPSNKASIARWIRNGLQHYTERRGDRDWTQGAHADMRQFLGNKRLSSNTAHVGQWFFEYPTIGWVLPVYYYEKTLGL